MNIQAAGPQRPYDIAALRSKDVVLAYVGEEFLIAKGAALLELIKTSGIARPAEAVRVFCSCWAEAEALKIVLNERLH